MRKFIHAIAMVVLAVLNAQAGTHEKVQLWEGGPYWATTNIGAENPEDYGLYFWWGDTTGHRPSGTTFYFNFSSDNSAIYTDGKPLGQLRSAGWFAKDGLDDVLAPAHDAAQVQWGCGWRIPTPLELGGLTSKCDGMWATMNGVNGYVVRGRGAYASNSIFLPFAGWGVGTSLNFAGSRSSYWASYWYANDYEAFILSVDSSGLVGHHDRRYCGFPIRPVQDFGAGSSGEEAVVSFNANGGTGTMAAQAFEDGKKQKLSKNLFKKDGYVFQGWVTNSVERAELAATGVIDVDYTDEQEITVDHDMTLYAVWANPPLTLTKESADWSSGSITLRCEDTDKSGAEHSYTLEYCNESGTWVAVDGAQKVSATKGQNANNEEVWIAKLTDSAFPSRLGGISTVHYRVEDENGRISGISTARHRYGIFVGIDMFQNNWRNRLSGCVTDATNMEKAFSEYGGCYYVQSLKNDAATKARILGSLDGWADGLLKAGDILLFYYASHGGVGSIACYGQNEIISAYELATYFHNLPQGLGLVVMLDTCYSTSMVARNVKLSDRSSSAALTEESSEHVDSARIFAEQVSQCLHSLCTVKAGARLMAQALMETSRLSDEEIGWITSVRANETSLEIWNGSVYSSLFTTEGIYKRGWLKGGADLDGDDFVSFGELGRWGMTWMAKNYDRYQRMSSYYHLPILNNIVAGSVPEHDVWAWLTAPSMLKSEHGLDGEINLSWNAVDGAGTYAVFRTVKGSSETNYLASVSGLTYVDGKKCALDPNLEYEYYIRAENEVDVSEASDSAGGTVSENTLLKDFVIQHMTDAQITGTTLVEHPPIEDGTVNYSNLNYDHDGDGFTTFEEYVIGSDPADATKKLSATIEMTNGIPHVTWSPNLNTNGIARTYTVWGKTNLTDEVWHTPTNSASHFFKVTVEMP